MGRGRNFSIVFEGSHCEDDDRTFNAAFEGFCTQLNNLGYSLVKAQANWEFQVIPTEKYHENKAKNPAVKLVYRDKGEAGVTIKPAPAGAGSTAGEKKKAPAKRKNR